jgi:hypothetical protein
MLLTFLANNPFPSEAIGSSVSIALDELKGKPVRVANLNLLFLMNVLILILQFKTIVCYAQ